MSVLHITNGDAAAELLRCAAVAGPILPWRDVLHEGPVPTGLSNDELDEVRIDFLGAQGWGDKEEIRKQFRQRNELLDSVPGFSEVVLWFEHDLYDQLQLIQILDQLGRYDPARVRISLICIGEFPGVERFTGLGQLSTSDLVSLIPGRERVTLDHLRLARLAWQAFRRADPSALTRLLRRDTSLLPFLDAALCRHLAQFPSVTNGLSRTERWILEGLHSGAGTGAALFRYQSYQEESPFFGDVCFYGHVSRLVDVDQPPLAVTGESHASLEKAHLHLTDFGSELLGDGADLVQPNGIDRWLGGVHLQGQDARWRWDEDARRLMETNKE